MVWDWISREPLANKNITWETTGVKNVEEGSPDSWALFLKAYGEIIWARDKKMPRIHELETFQNLIRAFVAFK